jgi:hypothetical protein
MAQGVASELALYRLKRNHTKSRIRVATKRTGMERSRMP